MKKLLWGLWLLVGVAQAQPVMVEKAVQPMMVQKAQAFLTTLSPEQQRIATYPLDTAERFTWYFFPHQRNGLPLKSMTEPQQKAAMALLQTGLSAQGYGKATSIMDLENVLRVVENRSNTDTYRDPQNYYFTVFGTPDAQKPWSWRVDGHHLSVHFVCLNGQVVGQTPTFFGSNPGVVRAEVPQKGKQLLKQETERAFALMKSLDANQQKQAIVDAVAYPDILTGNKRKASLQKMDGLRLGDMNPNQRRLFLELLQIYLTNYPITLAKQQMDKLAKAGLDNLRFAWAGDLTPELGAGKGWYYRIHGPTILIEYDNTQNNANHVHTVVRDLTNDFGDDVLAEHYRNSHTKKP